MMAKLEKVAFEKNPINQYEEFSSDDLRDWIEYYLFEIMEMENEIIKRGDN